MALNRREFARYLSLAGGAALLPCAPLMRGDWSHLTNAPLPQTPPGPDEKFWQDVRAVSRAARCRVSECRKSVSRIAARDRGDGSLRALVRAQPFARRARGPDEKPRGSAPPPRGRGCASRPVREGVHGAHEGRRDHAREQQLGRSAAGRRHLRGRARGILSLVDGAQAFGVLDLDLSAINPDFYTGSMYKWPCGPKETGLLYVNRKVHERLHPLIVGLYGGQVGLSRTFEVID